MKRRLVCLLVYSTVLLTPTAGAAAGGLGVTEPPSDDIDRQTLERLRLGEILVENSDLDESGGAARVQALFHATPAHIWDALGDCNLNLRFVDGLRECEIVSDTPTRAVTRQVVKKHFLAPRMEYLFESERHPYEWVAIRLIEGDLKVMEGSWRLTPDTGGDGVIVSHRIRVQPKMPVPRWLVRRALRRDIGDMVACLRSLVDGSLGEAGRAEDGKRCP